jgi:hypothetical protein
MQKTTQTIIYVLIFALFFILSCNSKNTGKEGDSIVSANNTDSNVKNVKPLSIDESKVFIEKVKSKYKNIKEYNSDGNVTEIKWILPIGGDSTIRSNIVALVTKEKLLFQFSAGKDGNLDLTWKNFEFPFNHKLSFPEWALKDPRKYMEDNAAEVINDNEINETENVKKEGKITASNNKIIVTNSRTGGTQEVEKLENAFVDLENQTLISFVLPTVFFPKNYDSFSHYFGLKDLRVEKEETYQDTNCYVLIGNSYSEPDSYKGIYIKMWIGKEDLLIRKIENYNVVENAVILTQEIHKNISVQ